MKVVSVEQDMCEPALCQVSEFNGKDLGLMTTPKPRTRSRIGYLNTGLNEKLKDLNKTISGIPNLITRKPKVRLYSESETNLIRKSLDVFVMKQRIIE